jgi:superfamily I DNA and RNA helicase
MSSYFYLHANQDVANGNFIEELRNYAEKEKVLIYVVQHPLGDNKYKYSYDQALIILSPKYKVSVVNYGESGTLYENFVEDLIEDIGFLSDKYLYREIIGRPRVWRGTLFSTEYHLKDFENAKSFFDGIEIQDPLERKKIELIISLFIGSINDVAKVKNDTPITILDKVKQKIQLFDGDQTRFIYKIPSKKRTTIQGLSGTGKTELLLHKLRELYIKNDSSRIYFTCHNKVLADNLKQRIPIFFNFMKVEQQIEWNKRLWCTNAWGGNYDENSGAYRYICSFYEIPFSSFSYTNTFDTICKKAIQDIKEKYKSGQIPYAFDYMLIDESQDFDEGFLDLCDLVTKEHLYIAGDVFQSIFDEENSIDIKPDYLLGKCYRTDPKTLMFAHALGMGLFEETKLRWLDEKEWEGCGYKVEVDENRSFHLSREPLRRFEDLDDSFESIKLIESDSIDFVDQILQILHNIQSQHPTVQPDDIGIIFLDSNRYIYEMAYQIEFLINRDFQWNVNKTYETKIKAPGYLVISNKNNVKGLEFPFVICVTKRLNNGLIYRNSLYTMLTRSFIQSFLLISDKNKPELIQTIKIGLTGIMQNKVMVIKEPSKSEQEGIKARFQSEKQKLSHYELMLQVFKALHVETKFHNRLLKMSQEMELIERDEETLKNFVIDTMKYMPK